MESGQMRQVAVDRVDHESAFNADVGKLVIVERRQRPDRHATLMPLLQISEE